VFALFASARVSVCEAVYFHRNFEALDVTEIPKRLFYDME
jgi:hypothetical protein